MGNVSGEVVMRKKFILHCVPAAAAASSTLNRLSGIATDETHVSPGSSSVVLAVRPSSMGEGIRNVSKGAPSSRSSEGL